MTPKTRPKAIIFDWDNTLIDSWVVIQETMNATFRDYAMAEWSLEDTKRRVAKSMRDSFPGLFGDRWEEAGERFYVHYRRVHLERLYPLPGAEDMLAGLHDMGVYLGVVSNKNGALLRAESEKLGWNRLFGNVVGATDAARDKPAPDPVRMALDGSGIDLGRDVWFAGDARIDMECAVNSGCVPVLVRETPPDAGEFAGVEPSLHADTPEALFKYAKNL
ncbi:MAG: HAD family hydrolase [Alphaproteobacteria bacterium]|nr:HAD family hydrolase [Alphaproteobacteria bacterium]MBF0249079.1 HAD family hydrolase [Alphaproteobacteria bacterium]